MGDNDLALRGVYGALWGRFRAFSKPLPPLGLRSIGAFGAFICQKVYLYKTVFKTLYTHYLPEKRPKRPNRP
tara:strand:- start:213 stop:428 length:216 start_codon:yes stop_codon:yes gene_type:complete